MVKATFYSCYSINLLRFIKAHGISPISKGVNKNSQRTFWVFEITEDLSRVLTAWSKTKKN